ncbi:MAG TPA: metallophosphoesterase [Oscillatoriaceae cyanobacterium M33_DOE_052]|uniref:Metallophosphoesterase n=1 Tax=Planktothricoides sp. SpSt-374 TaxID=2282167 RepID=A0A7C3ZX99_9CYAN|nr:metallophosphoesterase [Oscillatoriaceae cyanobacterium M33_DOE_052]
MELNFRFAVVSDPHVALPHTIWDAPNRFHLVEVSISALELVLAQLAEMELDFLLLPGDLTQHGEPDNHIWLANRLAQLPFPAYVIPGNHDVPLAVGDGKSIGWADFPKYYRHFGYQNPHQLYYTCHVLPGVRLIGLNSNHFDEEGKQIGRLDDTQLAWLQEVLAAKAADELVLVIVHHNVIEHLPDQAQHPMGRRYMLENAPQLRQILRNAGVELVFSGHLHVQDIAHQDGIYDITTGSLVSYPHPYRIFQFRTDAERECWLEVASPRVLRLPDFPDLPEMSREWMGDRSEQFMIRLLSCSPLCLPPAEAKKLAPNLRYFWADIAGGDAIFDFPEFPPAVRRYFHRFNASYGNGKQNFIDNCTTLPVGVKNRGFVASNKIQKC